MTDDLDDLKSMMTAATPKPDADKRAEHIALAQKNFDDLQGSRDGARPTSATGPKGLWTGVREKMKLFSLSGGLTVTTAIVAVGFVVLTPQGQSLWKPQGTVVTEADVPLPTTVQALQEQAPAADELVSSVATAQAEEQILDHRQAAPRTLTPGADAQRAAPKAEGVIVEIAPMMLGSEADAVADMAAPAVVVSEAVDALSFQTNIETFATADANPVKVTAEEPVSTFSIDVDTASYTVIRNSITSGYMPPRDAVRIEEMVNYFPYAYPAPEADSAPFRPTISLMQTPWNADTQLVTIGIQGEMPAVADRPPLNLVFLIDTSGSMDEPNKLPLLKQSFRLLLGELRPEDQVAIVEYAGSAGVALEPTQASDRQAIEKALANLGAGGSTNGVGGLQEAYAIAATMQAEGEVSRVLLATDGDFNVGLSDPDALKDFIAAKRETGVYLSVLGFGRGNLDDATMQALAQNGNGTAAYIDTLNEAQKVLVDQLTGALFPIADDVKIQVEWNPAAIGEYRLIGYETRALRREDFNNDKVDAGELGAGTQVTAIYEVTPVGSPALLNDPLRYQAGTQAADLLPAELGFLKMRWKEPGEGTSQLLDTPITQDAGSTTEAGFAAAIAGFGQLLQQSPYLGDWGWDEAIKLASESKGADDYGYRAGAIQLMRLAASLEH